MSTTTTDGGAGAAGTGALSALFREAGRPLLMPYAVGGYPDRVSCLRIVDCYLENGAESKKLSWAIQNSRLAPGRLLEVNISWPASRAQLDEVKFGVDLIGESHLFPARDGVLNITTPSPLWEGEFYTTTITFVFSTLIQEHDGMVAVRATFENCPVITGFYGQ